MWNVTLLMVGLLIFSGGGSAVEETQHTTGFSQPPIIHTASEVGQAHTGDNSLKSYGALNGISLTDHKREVIRKLGPPERIEHEKLSGITIFHYKEMEVGIRNGFTEYVHVDSEASSFQLEDQRISMTPAQIRATLGQPYLKRKTEMFILRIITRSRYTSIRTPARLQELIYFLIIANRSCFNRDDSG